MASVAAALRNQCARGCCNVRLRFVAGSPRLGIVSRVLRHSASTSGNTPAEHIRTPVNGTQDPVVVHFVDPGAGPGELRRLSVQAVPGETVVDVAKRYGIDIHAACGQQLQCATCHVIMEREHYERLPVPGVRENDMLETAYTLTDTSRLGCQVRLTPLMEGAEFTLPSKALKGLVRLTPESSRPKVNASWTSMPAVAPSASKLRTKAPPLSLVSAVDPAAGEIVRGTIAQEWEKLFYEQRNKNALLEQKLHELRGRNKGAGGVNGRSSPTRAAQVSTSSGGSGATDEDDQNELEKLKSELESTIVHVDSSRATSFDEVVGLDEAKLVLRESVLWPATGPPELFRGIRGQCRGVLLYGPPGCGKTMLARAAAAELCGADGVQAATFFHVRPSDVMSKFYGDSQKRVAALESLARDKSPAIVFLDEVDTLLGKRDGGNGVAEHHKGVTNALLTWMDGFDRSTERVFFIGATNRASAIDEAALRRFGDLVEIGLPNEAQRRDLLESLVRGAARDGHRSDLSPECLAAIAAKTEGMSGDDVARLTQQAFLEVLRELPGGVHRDLKLEDVPPVTAAHFDAAMRGGRARASRDVYTALQAGKPR